MVVHDARSCREAADQTRAYPHFGLAGTPESQYARDAPSLASTGTPAPNRTRSGASVPRHSLACQWRSDAYRL